MPRKLIDSPICKTVRQKHQDQPYLKDRGLSGVKLVISDAHKGLTAAVRKVLKAEAARRLTCRA